jgi:hypothetical protein
MLVVGGDHGFPYLDQTPAIKMCKLSCATLFGYIYQILLIIAFRKKNAMGKLKHNIRTM